MTFVTLERPSDLAAFGRQFEGRLSLQQAVVTFLIVEAALFLSCALAPNWYLPLFSLQPISDEQFELQIEAAVFACRSICSSPIFAGSILRLGFWAANTPRAC